MLKPMRVALVGLLVLGMAGAAAAATVTMTEGSGVRGGTQAPGTYKTLDFFWTNAAGADFTNYRIIANATAGNLADPARLQDDRQSTPPSGLAEGNTMGAVDTWANTVMSAAAKDDGGLTASYVFNTYNPAGSGAAPPFTTLDWDVFDTVVNDDNDLTDFPAIDGGPFNSGAPYHIARIVASENAQGTVQVLAFDNSQPGVPFVFNFGFGAPTNTPPVVGPEAPQTQTVNGEVITTDFDAVDAETPGGPFTWDVALGSFNPLFPGAVDNSPSPTIDANGVFSWNTLGAARGVYTWNVTATDGGPGAPLTSEASPFVVTVTAVPEPSTLALFGLALVGFFGFSRRGH